MIALNRLPPTSTCWWIGAHSTKSIRFIDSLSPAKAVTQMSPLTGICVLKSSEMGTQWETFAFLLCSSQSSYGGRRDMDGAACGLILQWQCKIFGSDGLVEEVASVQQVRVRANLEFLLASMQIWFTKATLFRLLHSLVELLWNISAQISLERLDTVPAQFSRTFREKNIHM